MRKSFEGNQQTGFTLVELSIVLVIIALLVVTVLGGNSLLDSSKTSNLVSTAKDLSAASIAFKERFKYWPGDLPLASNSIQNLPAACNIAIATANIGNGVIDTPTEINCAVEELFQAGMIRAVIQPGDAFHTVRTEMGAVRLVDAASSNVPNFPIGTNVVEFSNLRCEQALDFDRKIDDDNIDVASAGRSKSSVAACAAGTMVPFFAAALH